MVQFSEMFDSIGILQNNKNKIREILLNEITLETLGLIQQ